MNDLRGSILPQEGKFFILSFVLNISKYHHIPRSVHTAHTPFLQSESGLNVNQILNWSNKQQHWIVQDNEEMKIEKNNIKTEENQKK